MNKTELVKEIAGKSGNGPDSVVNFNHGDHDVFWADAKIIDEVKTKEKK